MPTLKKRVNLSLPEDVEFALDALSQRDHVPKAQKALELIRIALEIEEDRVWAEIVKKRQKDKRKSISHEKAWS